MRRRDEEKSYTSVSSSVGWDAYSIFLVTFVSAAYITEQQQKIIMEYLLSFFGCVWNKKVCVQ